MSKTLEPSGEVCGSKESEMPHLYRCKIMPKWMVMKKADLSEFWMDFDDQGLKRKGARRRRRP
jgi:hypothetical protein